MKRYKPLIPEFAKLTEGGGALRASTSAEIKTYIEAYRKFSEKWFSEFALKLRESRAKMKRYIGKTRTLSSFFSKVRKDAEKIKEACKMSRIEVAYGACGPSMSPSGRGELAVPTTGAYKACVRAFTKAREGDKHFGRNVVSLEDESFTSKMCWETGKAYEKVYKVHDVDGKEYLKHTKYKCAPLVNANDIQAVSERKLKNKLKGVIRRGGGVPGPDNNGFGGEGGIVELRSSKTIFDGVKDARGVHHIEVRGLLFCQENSMFFSRDERSAHAIAGLRCIKLSGLGRPSSFRRKVQKKNESGQSLAVVETGEESPHLLMTCDRPKG
jgi:hypothetical protein